MTDKEKHDEEPQSSWPGLQLSLVALLVSIGGAFNFGYQLLITNPAEAAFKHFVNESIYKFDGAYPDNAVIDTTWGMLLSLFFWGATLGAFLIQFISEFLGRKWGMVATFALQSVAMELSLLSFVVSVTFTPLDIQMINHYIYGASRFLLGFALSVSLGIAPLYITECSPARCRGVISLATAILMQSALVFGAVLAMPQIWGTTDKWWLLYASEMVVTLIVTVLSCFIHDSPGYLISRNKNKAAIAAIVVYHGVSQEEAEKAATKLQEQNHGDALGLCAVFGDPQSRRGTILGCVVMGAMIQSGIAAINAFAFEILKSVGLDDLSASLGNVVICVMTVIGVIAASLLIDRWGRRPLLITMYIGLAFINALLYALMAGYDTFKQPWLGWCVVATICIFNVVFCLGPCPIAFFLTGEVVGQQGRAAACTWANVVLNAVRSVFLVIYFPLKTILGASLTYFTLFFPPCFLVIFYLYYNMPETKGRTPEEAQEEMNRLPRLCGKAANYSPAPQETAVSYPKRLSGI